MNHVVNTYRNRLALLFASIGVATLMVGASGFFLKGALSDNAEGIAASNKACLATMRSNGISPTVEKNGDILKVVLATSNEFERLVYKTGVIIASCPAYTVSDYCAGAGCQHPGVTFTLKQKELQ